MCKKKIVISAAVFAVLAIIILCLLTRLVSPKYSEHLVEGSMTSQYYSEDREHDLIIIGDCEVYANISPMILWEQYGITAYVRGNSQQLIWQSYYILSETLKYEIPKAVVLSVGSMRYSEPVKEEYNRLAIDLMRWSEDKIGIIRASMGEDESFASYLFPIIRYHSRITELTSEDFRYFFSTKRNTFNGFLMEKDTVPYSGFPRETLRDPDFAESNYIWLDKICALCNENSIRLILFKAPRIYPVWFDEYDAQISEYAAERGLEYYNFDRLRDEIGIDYSQDTYDGGMHLNVCGAEKLSGYFGRILAESGLPDRRGDDVVLTLYNEKLEKYINARESDNNRR
ncbi:MAG: SGNH/GDSL hydrolase family protein [Clostridia bacterium]|nr:SGNH/GDSL hydrolase family protein [Clostridia bacterium]